MAGTKELLLLTSVIIFTFSAAAISFNIEVSDITSKGVYEMKYTNSTGDIQEVNMTVENFGSIGCEFRLVGRFNRSDGTETTYSKGYAIWPGDTAFTELVYFPENYTGQVDSSISIEYCGQRDVIERFSFNATGNNTVPDQEVDSRELSANSTTAVVRTDIEEGYLVPERTPAGWKVSSVKIEDGEAVAGYDAPLFNSELDITYTVLDSSGDPVGTTTVDLDVKPTLLDRLTDNIWKILFGISIIANLGLFFGRKRLKQQLNL